MFNVWFVSVKIIIKLTGFSFLSLSLSLFPHPRSFFICVEPSRRVFYHSRPWSNFVFISFRAYRKKYIIFIALPGIYNIRAPWRNILMCIKFVLRINISVVYNNNIIGVPTTTAAAATGQRFRAGLRPRRSPGIPIIYFFPGARNFRRRLFSAVGGLCHSRN